MVTCVGCERTRGMLGRLTWHECGECDSPFCPDCFGQLVGAEPSQTERPLPARACSQCGTAIVTPVAVGGGISGPGW